MSLVLSCGFLINFQRCHPVFFVAFPGPFVLCFFCLSRTKTSSNIQPPSTLSANIQGAAAAFILFDFYQPVPPSGWFFYTFLYFWWSKFLWQKLQFQPWDWKVAWWKKLGKWVMRACQKDFVGMLNGIYDFSMYDTQPPSLQDIYLPATSESLPT